MAKKTYYSISEAAKLLELHPDTVRDMCIDGRIKAKQIGGKHGRWRINVRVIEEILR